MDSATKERGVVQPGEKVPASARVGNKPWSGVFAEQELGKPGGMLIAALTHHAAERGDSISEMAAKLDVSYSYINQLRNGVRPTSQVSTWFSQACAEYLGVPRMTVLMLAGAISVEDVFEAANPAQSAISRAFSFLQGDQTWAPLLTPEVVTGSLQTKYLVIRLYEEATSHRLLPDTLNIERLAEGFGEFAKERAKIAYSSKGDGQ